MTIAVSVKDSEAYRSVSTKWHFRKITILKCRKEFLEDYNATCFAKSYVQSGSFS